MNTNELNQLTPAPWKWVFLGNAGNYFLLGNDGAGPIVQGSPGFPDGNLMQAAPALLAACEAIQEAFSKGEIKFTKIRQADSDPYHPANVKLAAAIAAAKGE